VTKINENISKVLRPLTEGKRPSGRDRNRWEDNTKANLNERGWVGVDWIHLAQDRGHGNKIPGSIQCWEFLDQLSIFCDAIPCSLFKVY
jgi:hypothetical protein